MCTLLWMMLKKSNQTLVKKAMEYSDNTFVPTSVEFNEHGSTDIENFKSGRRVFLKIELTLISLCDLSCHDKQHSVPAVEVMYSMEARATRPGSRLTYKNEKSLEVHHSRDILLLYARERKSLILF